MQSLGDCEALVAASVGWVNGCQMQYKRLAGDQNFERQKVCVPHLLANLGYLQHLSRNSKKARGRILREDFYEE